MRKTVLFHLVALLLFSVSLFASENPSHSMHQKDPVFSSYETLRMALLHDELGDVAEAAGTLSSSSRKLASTSHHAKESLEAVSGLAKKMTTAKDLEAARAVFGELSEEMIRYRATVDGERPVVVECPMLHKRWLQPDETIGNPYYGQSMASCGSIVPDAAGTADGQNAAEGHEHHH